MITFKNVHFAKAPLIFKGRLKGRPSADGVVSTWNSLTRDTQACKVGGILSNWNELGGWGLGGTLPLVSGKVCRPAEFQQPLWETIISQGTPDDCLITKGLHIDFLPQQDRTLLKDSLFSFWVFIISRRWGFWHLRQKNAEVTSRAPVRRRVQISLECDRLFFVPPPAFVNVSFTWRRTTMRLRDNVVYGNAWIHMLYSESSFFFFNLGGGKKERQRRRRRFWDRTVTSKRKTCIIDEDTVRVPFGQQLFSWRLNVQLVTSIANLMTTFSDTSVNPVIIHVA